MKKNLVFLGHGAWATECLEAAFTRSSFRIPLVFLHASPGEAQRRNNAEMEDLAVRHGSRVIFVEEAGEMKADVVRTAPDLLVSVGFLKKVPREVLEIPSQGAINLHGALLPRYRGRAPISWALLNGEKHVGITVHYMEEEIDSGPILIQRRIRVSAQDTACTLYERMKRLAPAVLLEALKMFETGTPSGVPQDERSATRYGKLTQEVCLIRWGDPAKKIHDKIRALVPPYPGAFTFSGGRKYIVVRSALPEDVASGSAPGRVLEATLRGALVGTGEGSILIEEVEREHEERGVPDWVPGETLSGEA
jgi:UDP-4-amino-4-deoxy-L-arabinose formyltransferase/UDP-glucuronic acid dehydrogenase (UDP-4-keto-hexauronic acid decarboxylating)